MKPREIELRELLAKHQGNPYAAQSPAARELGQLELERTIRQNEANEIFKEGLKRRTELIKLREQGRMDQAKRILDVQKIEAGKKSHTETVDGRFWRYDPTTRKWTDITPLR